MSTGSGAVPGSAAPTAWMIRPQFGSPPYSAVLTSEESATARATALHRLLVAAADHDPADAPGALAVADDHQRQLAHERVERLAEAQLVLGLGLDGTPEAPLHCRITVSLVDSWPSTLIRSNERLTQTPSSRSLFLASCYCTL